MTMIGHTDLPIDNVISLNRYRETVADPQRRLEQYWSSLRDGADIPRRGQIDPRDLSDILQHVFILEQNGRNVARFRIAGTQLAQLAGMEVRGMPMSAFMRPPARETLSSAIGACLNRPAIIEAQVRARSLQPGYDLSGSMILLPMRCDQGHVSRILGAVVVNGDIRSDAYRLDISAYSSRPVCGPATVEPLACGVAEPRSPFIGAPRLKLVHSQDPH